jgi:hypothetical protein
MKILFLLLFCFVYVESFSQVKSLDNINFFSDCNSTLSTSDNKISSDNNFTNIFIQKDSEKLIGNILIISGSLMTVGGFGQSFFGAVYFPNTLFKAGVILLVIAIPLRIFLLNGNKNYSTLNNIQLVSNNNGLGLNYKF